MNQINSLALASRTMFNVLHLEKIVKLDPIVRKDTAYRRREFERRARVQLPGFEAGLDPEERRYRVCRRFYGELADHAFGRG